MRVFVACLCVYFSLFVHAGGVSVGMCACGFKVLGLQRIVWVYLCAFVYEL